MYTENIEWHLRMLMLSAAILFSAPVWAENLTQSGTSGARPSVLAQEQATQGLTLDAAITRALVQSPRLQAFGSGVAAAKAEQHKAGAWANPEIQIAAENIAGSGPYNGFQSAEVTYGVAQQIEIGGKISAREAIADKGMEIANLEQQAAGLDIIRDVTTAYAEAVAAEENVRLAKEQQDLAEDVLKSVSVRVGAAASPLIHKSRAEVERSTAMIAEDKAMRERTIARKHLAALMGDAVPVALLDHTAFYTIVKLSTAALDEKLKTNPDIKKLDTSLEQSRERFELEKANAIPDPRVNVGVRDFNASNDKAFMVGLTLPIPVFDLNRGGIEKARHEVSQTAFNNQQSALGASSALTQAQQQMENALFQAEKIKIEILPSATRAFQLAREGYGLGRFPYLEVLDAQRSLFGVKQQRISALKDYHTARAIVERLTAMHMDKVKYKGEQDEE